MSSRGSVLVSPWRVSHKTVLYLIVWYVVKGFCPGQSVTRVSQDSLISHRLVRRQGVLPWSVRDACLTRQSYISSSGTSSRSSALISPWRVSHKTVLYLIVWYVVKGFCPGQSVTRISQESLISHHMVRRQRVLPWSVRDACLTRQSYISSSGMSSRSSALISPRCVSHKTVLYLIVWYVVKGFCPGQSVTRVSRN
jgi:uncharacterized membrane protein YhdT